ncbi:MAG: T9SS type A sorting domain-containing protein [Flavobacteriia bacterium]|nr:T9SS type A sorting domain-containing protein [Flavobacteriia bacterium]
MKKLLLTLTALFTLSFAQASHFAGGYITAVCNDDPNTSQVEYLLSATVAFDHGGAPAPSTLSIQYPGGPAALNQVSNYFVTVGSYTVNIIRYEKVVSLQPNTQYNFEYSICCRPAGIVNLTGQPSIYINTTLNTGASCNSTPVLLTPVALNWPRAVYWNTTFTSFDFDGDSLVYALDTPMSSANQQVPGYFEPHIPNGSPSIDPNTGLFTYGVDTSGFIQMRTSVAAYDASGTNNSTVNIEFTIGTNMANSNFPGFMNLQVDVNVGQADEFTFDVAKNDTLTFVASADSSVNANVYYPSFVDQNQVFVDVQQMKHTAVTAVDFSWFPTQADAGMEFPVVVRFESEGFSKDYTFTAKSQNSVGLMELDELNATLYPNPVSDRIHLEFDGDVKSVSIMTTSGQIVDGRQVDSGTQELDMPISLESGVYFIQLHGADGGVKTLPMIVK